MTAQPPGAGSAPQIPPGVPWVPPTRPVAATLGVPGLAFAGVGARFVAYLFDQLILVIPQVVLAIPLGSLADESWGALFAVSILSLAISYAYYVILWTGPRRSTFGMRVFRLQVGRAFDGHRIDLRQASLRWLAFGSWLGVFAFTAELQGLIGVGVGVWMAVLLVSAATSDTRQGLHDRIARTAIVGPEAGWNAGLVKGCLIGLGIVIALWLLAVLALILLGGQMSRILSEVGSSI